MTNEYYFLNVIDSDLQKILLFSKSAEEKYDRSVLTGINFAHTKDNSYLLGFVFTTQQTQKECLELAEKIGFKRIYTTEEDWTGITAFSNICIIGNFSYSMFKKKEEEPMGCIELSVESYNKLKKAYEEAVEEKQDIFFFGKEELVTNYAKYLLIYMKDRLNIK
jgi:hypothetical protein